MGAASESAAVAVAVAAVAVAVAVGGGMFMDSSGMKCPNDAVVLLCCMLSASLVGSSVSKDRENDDTSSRVMGWDSKS